MIISSFGANIYPFYSHDVQKQRFVGIPRAYVVSECADPASPLRQWKLPSILCYILVKFDNINELVI